MAFYTACLFRGHSATFRFCACAAYRSEDVAEFIVRSLRSRAKSDSTLTRASEFAGEFHTFATSMDPPFPFCGQESLIAVTKWLDSLVARGGAIPSMGRYSLKVYGGALVVTFPTDRPAVLQAVTVVRSKPKSAPGLDTDLVFALDAGANNKGPPSGRRLYCALFSLLAYTSLHFGDTRLAQDLWRSETAVCGAIINNKDKSGGVMHCAAPGWGYGPSPDGSNRS